MSDILPVPGCTMGIDVSHYQGQIDWTKVAGCGVKFAWIKATDGDSVCDPMLNANLEGATAAGLVIGLYHFWRPQFSPQSQADLFMAHAEGGTHLEAIDIEVGTLLEDNQQEALEFLYLIDDPLRTATQPFVYVSPGYAQVNLTDPAWLQYPLWIAHYTEASQPNILKWPEWTFWQRQANGSVDGVSTAVDIDWFQGSEEDLRKLVVLPT